MAKSNLQYLQELLNDNTEALEWLDGLTTEYQDKIDDLKEDLEELKSELGSANGQISDLEDEVDNNKVDAAIDFGLAKIEYRTSGNLKVDQYMEDLAEKVKMSF